MITEGPSQHIFTPPFSTGAQVCNIYISYVSLEPVPQGWRGADGTRAYQVFVGSGIVEVRCPPYGVLMVVGGGAGECAGVFAELLRRYAWAAPCIASALDIVPGEEAWVRELLERVLALMAV